MPATQSHSPRWLLIGFLLSAVGAMLFAIKGVLVKLIYVYGADSTTLITLRMGLSVPIFAAIGWADWRRRPVESRPDRRTLFQAALIGILGFYVSSWLDFEGLEYIGAQPERLILFTYPFLVILFGWLLLRQPLRRHAVGGAALSYAGLMLMFGLEPARMTADTWLGSGLVASAAVTFALYQLFARELILRCGVALFTAVAMSAAGGAIFVHFLLTHPLSALALPAPAWPMVIIMALFATVLSTFMMSAGTARIGAQGTAIISTLSPLVTIILAIVFLDEPFGLPEALGTVFVIGGVGLFSLVESRKNARAKATVAEIAETD